MEELRSKLTMILSLVAKARKGKLINAEVQRFRSIFGYCETIRVTSAEEQLKEAGTILSSNTFERIDSAVLMENDNSASHPALLQASAFKVPVLRGQTDYGGMLKSTETVQQCISYISLTLSTIEAVLSASMICEKMKIRPEGFKIAAIAINHRLRICRLMLLLHAMNQNLAYAYLDSLDKVEAQNLLHLLQFIVVDSSIIDRFTYTTFEQVAYGIDTYHTVLKIKRLLREPLVLLSRHVCNHRHIGEMLDSYFQQHTELSFDLLINALSIHYELTQQSQLLLAQGLQRVFEIETTNDSIIPQIKVQEFILFTDFVSLPEFMTCLENGVRLRCKSEDLLLKDLKMPRMGNYQLLKSYTKFDLEIMSMESLSQRLIILNLLGMNGLSFKSQGECKVIFENSLDGNFLDSLFSQLEDLANYSSSHHNKSSFFKKSIHRVSPKKGESPKNPSASLQMSINSIKSKDLQSVTKALARFQQHAKQRMMELIDLETREKEIHAGMTVQIDWSTTYKPIIHPNMVRFNEELYNDFQTDLKQQESASKRTNSLLSNIIQKLEQTNLQQEKLAVLRKMQKEKEKKHILKERIDVESASAAGNAVAEAAISPKHAGSFILKDATKTIQTAPSNVFGSNTSTNRMATMPIGEAGKKISNNFLSPVGEDGTGGNSTVNLQPPQPFLQTSLHRPPTLMKMTPNSLWNHSPMAIHEPPPQKSIDQLNFECEMQQQLIQQLQDRKSQVVLQMERLESLMLKSDLHFARERHQLIKQLQFHEAHILEKEQNIRNLLAEIADSEMKRNIMSDELEESTLRTIEVINISDIRIERENLERETIELERKQAEFEKIENELLRQKEHLDEKRRRRKLGLTTTAPAQPAAGAQAAITAAK